MLPEIYGETISDSEIDDDMAAYMAYGVTAVVVLNGNESVLKARERSKKTGSFLPRIFSSSPILDGAETHNPVHIKIDGQSEAIAAVDSAVASGYDLIKVYNDLDSETRNAVISRANKAGRPVVGHLPPAMSLDESLVPGFSNVAHAEEITRTWDGEDSTYFTKAVTLMEKHSITFTPNLVAYREIADEIDNIKNHLAQKDWKLTPPIARVYATPPFNGYVKDFGGEDIRERAIKHFVRNAASMDELTLLAHKAGVMILAGTDTGNPTMFAGQSLMRELNLLGNAGLDAYDVLSAATINVAKMLGHEDEYGSIAKGKFADIVLLNVNPVEANTLKRENVSAVIKAGVLFDKKRIAGEVKRLGIVYDKRENRYYKAAMETHSAD